MYEQTLSNTIDEAIEKLKALRPVVKWHSENALHSQKVCLIDHLMESAYDDTDAEFFMDTVYLDMDNLHLYIAEPNQSMYYYTELIPDECDLHDIAYDVRYGMKKYNMSYVNAKWLTDKDNREFLIKLIEDNIKENKERLQSMVDDTWDELDLECDIEYDQSILDRLMQLN